MENKPLDLLVCYDVCDPKRLAKIRRCMIRWGVALQYSVFYCKLTKPQRNLMEQELRKLIDEKVDNIRVYGLKSSESIKFIGKPPWPDGVAMLGVSALANMQQDNG